MDLGSDRGPTLAAAASQTGLIAAGRISAAAAPGRAAQRGPLLTAGRRYPTATPPDGRRYPTATPPDGRCCWRSAQYSGQLSHVFVSCSHEPSHVTMWSRDQNTFL